VASAVITFIALLWNTSKEIVEAGAIYPELVIGGYR
jgi:hypothetical protein